jgi:HEPN domain-containing protein
MDRSDLQILAETRVADAEALLQMGRWAAAYYLLGYAIECGLKACAVKQFREHEVPDRKVVNDFYTHRLDQLLNISGVKDALEQRAAVDQEFQKNWNAVRDWSEASRYEHATTEAKARDMLIAVTDTASGVLTWLKTQW